MGAELAGGDGVLTAVAAGEEAARDDCDDDEDDEGDPVENVLPHSCPCVFNSFSHCSLCCLRCDIFSSNDFCDFSNCSICCKLEKTSFIWKFSRK